MQFSCWPLESVPAPNSNEENPVKKLMPVLSLLLALVAASCTGGGPTGKYKLDIDKFLDDNPAIAQMLSMVPKDKQAEMRQKMKSQMSGTLDIKADGTFTVDQKSGGQAEKTISGTWKAVGDKVTLTSKKDGKDQVATGTATGNTIAVTMTEGGVSLKMTFSK